MKIGIIGPSQSGKSTTFHLLTGTEPNPHALFKREVQMGMSTVRDPRVDRLAELSDSRKRTYLAVEYFDMPPLESGAAKSDWFTAAIDGGIKTAEALLLVVRAFGADQIAGGINPLRDVLAVQEELVLADLIALENRLERIRKQRKVKPLSGEEHIEIELLTRAHAHASAGAPLRTLQLVPAERKPLKGFQFLSEKSLLVLVNSAEDKLADMDQVLSTLNAELAPLQAQAIALSARLEGDIARLPEADRPTFMADLGVTELARDRVVHASFDLLGLLTFLTTGDRESRIWPLHKGDTALDAAAEIHTDLARGFIRAEVVHFDDFVREGGYPGCKAKGLLRLEGRDYPVKDGDVLLIRHSS